jgi:hypothetical protein
MARNLDPGTPLALLTPPSSVPPSPPMGSRFSVLDSIPLDHLDQVAIDCSVIFHGEHGPRLEQIATIKAKEICEGDMAAARAQAERERVGTPEPTRPVQLASGSSNGTAPMPSGEAAPSVTP